MRPLRRAAVSCGRRRPGSRRNQVPQMRHGHPLEASRAHTRKPRASGRAIMTWLYVPHLTDPDPSKASRSALALADWSSASTSQNPDIGLFVTSSGKSSLRGFSWPGWKTRPWITRLSGTMSAPSTADLGAAAWISSLPATRASRSHSQDGGAAMTTPDTSGPRSSGSSARSGRSGSSARTSRATSPWEPPRCSTAFARWGTAQKQACFRRSKRARASFGDGSSLWPTPTKSLYANNCEVELSAQGMKLRDDPGQVGSQISTGKAARTWTLIWLLIRSAGAVPTRTMRLEASRPLHLILRPGLRYSTGDLIFNPNFSDWVMGWPIGWTDPMRPVTGWSAWLQRMRGALSELPMIDENGDAYAVAA